MSLRNHEVVEQRNLVKPFHAIKFLTRDRRGLSPWWLKWITLRKPKHGGARTTAGPSP